MASSYSSKNLQKSRAGRLGWLAYVNNHFGGNEALASDYVAQMGTVVYFNTYRDRLVLLEDFINRWRASHFYLFPQFVKDYVRENYA